MVESSKKTKDPTRLRNIVIRHMDNNRVLVQINLRTNRTSDPNHGQFVSYLGVLA